MRREGGSTRDRDGGPSSWDFAPHLRGPNFPPSTNFVRTEGLTWREETSGILYDEGSGLFSDPTTGANLYYDVNLHRFASWGSARASAPAAPKKEPAPVAKAATTSQPEAPGVLNVWNQKSKELREEPISEPKRKPTGPIKIELGFGKRNTAAPKVAKPTNIDDDSKPVAEASAPASEIVDLSSSFEEPQIQQADPDELPFTNGLICLLCKKAFHNGEKIGHHVAASQLHKRNLEILLALQEKQTELMGARDRAAERRALFGEENITRRKASAVAAAYEPPTKMPKTENADNFKNRGEDMMRKMGWGGAGLGREEQGAVQPVAVSMRAERAGLGTDAPESSIQTSDSYADAVRKRARERFDRLMQHPQ